MTARFDGESWQQMEARKAAEKAAFEQRWKDQQARMGEFMEKYGDGPTLTAPWVLPERWSNYGRPEYSDRTTWQVAMNDLIESFNELYQQVQDIKEYLLEEDT